MESQIEGAEKFEPELFCLRCRFLEWDEEARRCANFDNEPCPLFIRQVLAGMEMNCWVV